MRALEATQGQIDYFFSQLPYKRQEAVRALNGSVLGGLTLDLSIADNRPVNTATFFLFITLGLELSDATATRIRWSRHPNQVFTKCYPNQVVTKGEPRGGLGDPRGGRGGDRVPDRVPVKRERDRGDDRDSRGNLSLTHTLFLTQSLPHTHALSLSPFTQPVSNTLTLSLSNLTPYAATIHPKPYTLNPAPSTLHPQPYTLNPTP